MDYYEYSSVEKIPEKMGNFKDKSVNDWTWLDFFNYFEAQKFQKTPIRNSCSLRERNSRKKTIEKAMETWGRQTFKAMIDWLFDNYKDHPEWKSLHIGLLCGNHNWAKMIGENAIKQMEVDKKWNS